MRKAVSLERLSSAVETMLLGAWCAGVFWLYLRSDPDGLRRPLAALASITDGGKLGALVEFAKGHYAQEAIYLRFLGVSEIL